MSVIKSIKETFNKFYPNLSPEKVYATNNGYIIYAPIIKNATDFSNPYYFMDDKYKKVTVFNMIDHKKLFAAFKRGPIWKSSKE